MTYLFSQGHWKLSDGFNGNIIDSSFPPRKTQTYKLSGHQQSTSMVPKRQVLCTQKCEHRLTHNSNIKQVLQVNLTWRKLHE